MKESFPKPSEMVKSKEQIREEKLTLAREMFERAETFPFPGIDDAAYAELKSAEDADLKAIEDGGHPKIDIDDYFKETTSVDNIRDQCIRDGVKILVKGTNIMILPAGSNRPLRDSIQPEQLNIDSVFDENLRKIIKLSKSA